MLGNWSNTGRESITQRVMGRVRPDEPLKNKIGVARKKLRFQITKLAEIDEKLKKKHDIIFEKIVNAQKSHNNGYASVYAGELVQVRKMKGMIGGAKLKMEQIDLRLDTMSGLGDVVVTLSPCMSIIKGLAPSLGGIMPEANASMQDISEILGDIMAGSTVSENAFSPGAEASADTLAILEEAHSVIAGNAKASIPDVPDDLKQQIVEKKPGIMI